MGFGGVEMEEGEEEENLKKVSNLLNFYKI
jgi:hypothetical protein